MKLRSYILSTINKYLFPVYFAMHYLLKGKKNYKNELKLSANYNLPTFDFNKFKLENKNNKNKTLFILGGGQSINEISEKGWEFINNNTSIALNNWWTHPFEPNFIMIEGFKQSIIGSELNKWRNKYLPIYAPKSRAVFLVKDIDRSKDLCQFFSEFPCGKAYAIPKISIPGRTNESVRKSMRILSLTNIPNLYPLFSRASVTLAISIGLKLDYKKIVLCGFDMNDGSYFWEVPDFKPHPLVSLPPSTGQSDINIHSTVDKRINPITVDQCIYSLNDEILDKYGIELLVSSKNSKLYPTIQEYEWNLQ